MFRAHYRGFGVAQQVGVAGHYVAVQARRAAGREQVGDYVGFGVAGLRIAGHGPRHEQQRLGHGVVHGAGEAVGAVVSAEHLCGHAPWGYVAARNVAEPFFHEAAQALRLYIAGA